MCIRDRLAIALFVSSNPLAKPSSRSISALACAEEALFDRGRARIAARSAALISAPPTTLTPSAASETPAPTGPRHPATVPAPETRVDHPLQPPMIQSRNSRPSPNKAVSYTHLTLPTSDLV